jgi:hypothetical protein
MVRVAESTPTFTFCPRQNVTMRRHHLGFARRIRDTLAWDFGEIRQI